MFTAATIKIVLSKDTATIQINQEYFWDPPGQRPPGQRFPVWGGFIFDVLVEGGDRYGCLRLAMYFIIHVPIFIAKQILGCTTH